MSKLFLIFQHLPLSATTAVTPKQFIIFTRDSIKQIYLLIMQVDISQTQNQQDTTHNLRNILSSNIFISNTNNALSSENRSYDYVTQDLSFQREESTNKINHNYNKKIRIDNREQLDSYERTINQLRKYGPSPRQQLEDYRQQEEKNNKAKWFIAKVKKMKEINEGKLLIKRQEQEQRKLLKEKEEQQIKNQMMEFQRMKRRIAAQKKIKQYQFKKQKREEEGRKKIEKNQRFKTEGNEIYKQPIHKSVKLYPISEHIGKTPTTNKLITFKTQPTERQQKLPSISSLNRQINKSQPKRRTYSRVDGKLSRYIYLTTEDDHKIQQIKKKLDQLTHLSSQKPISKPNKKLFKI